MQYIVKDTWSIGIDKEYNILSSLGKEYENLLLHRCDTKLSELSKEYYDELKEDYFEGYCTDIIALKFEEHFKIKVSIVNYLQENKLLQYKNHIGMDKTYEYYKNMVENCFNMYSYEVVDQIKNIIMDIAYCSDSTYKTDFIDERILFSNYYFLDEDGMQKVDFTNIWYKPNDREEIIYAMKEEAIYSGIILNIENQFDYLATSFCKVETASDYDLIIRLKDDEKFSEKTKDIIREYNLQIVTL